MLGDAEKLSCSLGMLTSLFLFVSFFSVAEKNCLLCVLILFFLSLIQILENDRANDWEGSGTNEAVKLQDEPPEPAKKGCCS